MSEGEAVPSIRSSIFIAREPEAVFDFATTAAAWPTWHPASLRVSTKADGPAGVGVEILEDVHVIGPKDQLTWTVTEAVRPSRWVFEGGSPRSGRAVITYTLDGRNGGTNFQRDLSYTAANPVLAVLERLFVRRRMIRQSDQALHALKSALESDTG